MDHTRAAELLAKEEALVERRYKEYKYLSARTFYGASAAFRDRAT